MKSLFILYKSRHLYFPFAIIFKVVRVTKKKKTRISGFLVIRILSCQILLFTARISLYNIQTSITLTLPHSNLLFTSKIQTRVKVRIMIHYKLEAGVDYNSVGPAEPEMQSLTKESSCYRIQDSGDRGETEPKKKPKKLWSIKLSRLPSLRSSTRRAKSRHDPLPIVLYANPSSTPPPIPIEISDAPPCYMKATRSSDARRGSLQASF